MFAGLPSLTHEQQQKARFLYVIKSVLTHLC